MEKVKSVDLKLYINFVIRYSQSRLNIDINYFKYWLITDKIFINRQRWTGQKRKF